ncbi:MAG: hypothetical protein HY721_02015 [Planctomycetes bacterium]|nr:hypothetical protein [Planctomycetota bacterium]
MEGPAPLLLYLIVKYAAYAGWCSLGVRLVRRDVGAWAAAGMGWGLARLFMGFLFGIVILELVDVVYRAQPRPSSFGLYLSVYVPVRILEWGIMVSLLARFPSRAPLGRSQALRVVPWILGGVIISCLADVPVFIALMGFPVGRFWC